MKKLFVIFFLILTLLEALLLPRQTLQAQKIKSWELGLSALTGQNFYNRKYYDQPQLPNGRETDFKSNYLRAAGIWAEKHLNRRFSITTELRYAVADMPTNTLCECSYVASAFLQKEKHYWGSAGLGLRYYINPKSKVSFFMEGGAEADWLIVMKEKRNDKIYAHWNAKGYSHFAPSVSLAAGAKWKWITLSGGLNTNIARTIIRDIGIYEKMHQSMKTGISFRGLYAKAAFTLVKIRK